MKIKTLENKKHLDYPEEFRIRFITSKTEREVLHNHEYFEIFLTLTDNVKHIINQKNVLLQKGSLVLIRPNDIHLYNHDDEPYSFINLAYSTDLNEKIFNLFKDCMPVDTLLASDLPPVVVLSGSEQKSVRKLLHKINLIDIDNHLERKAYCISALVTIYNFFSKLLNEKEYADDIPQWLQDTHKRMLKEENFCEGLPAMIRISGMSYEHLSRSMKKYYDTTPTSFINDLRINFAANLIKNTNMSLTDIYLECGFNNGAHFNKCFKQKFNVSPSQYKKKLFT